MISSQRQWGRILMMLAVCVGCTATVGANPAFAQSSASATGEGRSQSVAPSPDQDQGEYEIIRLDSMNAGDAIRLVKSIAPNCRVGIEERTNSVVVRGPRSEVLATIEMLRAIDASQESGSKARTTQVVNVDYISDHFLDLLREVMSSPWSHLAYDEDTGVLAMRGTAQEIDTARKLLEEAQLAMRASLGHAMDEGRALMMNFYFIKARFQPDPDDPPSPPLPDILTPVAAAMEEHGFYQPGLLASLMVRTEAGEAFEAQGTIPSEESRPIRVEVNGMTISGSGPRPLELQVSAQVAKPAGAGLGESQPMITVFQLDTQIRVQLGEFVVLAATPSTAGMFDAIALVVRVTGVDGAPRVGDPSGAK